ncbi:MAG: FAD-binding protein, partial [Bacteroidetes bacterium]
NDNKIDFEFIDVDLDEKATNLVETINNGKRIIPTIIIDDKSYTNPDNAQLAAVLGINKTGKVVMFGADWCPDCRRAKSYLRNNNINFQFIDVDVYEWATDKVVEINKGKRIIPTILIDDVAYSNPDNAVLKDVLKIGDTSSKEVFHSIIVGAGAAGLTASIYAQRDKFSTLILEKKNIGGNASLTKLIENYPGFTNISGPELMDKMADQAKTYGAKIETGVEVKNIIKENNQFTIKTNMGDYYAKSVVLSVGSSYRRLHIPNEDKLIGSGVHFCATCDGAFYRDKEILVIGGGNSALEESIFLSTFVKKVTIINKNETFKASETYIEKLPGIENIEVVKNHEPVEFVQNEDGSFKGLKTKDKQSGEMKEFFADGAFIFIGLVPNTGAFKDIVEVDEQGFIKTSGYGETSVEGIFAAGDAREGAIAQVAAATGEGVLASYGLRNYLS